MIIHCNFKPKNRDNLVPGELMVHHVRDQPIFGIVLQDDAERKKMLRLDRIHVQAGFPQQPAFKKVNVPDGVVVSLGSDWIIEAEEAAIPPVINDQAPRSEGRLSRSEEATFLALIDGGQFDDQLTFVNLETWAIDNGARPQIAVGNWRIWANAAHMKSERAQPLWQSPR